MGKEVVVSGKALLHSAQVASKEILPPEDVHAREMVDSLIGFHPVEAIALDCSIAPEDVPVVFVTVREFDFVHFGDGADDGVVAVADVDEQTAIAVFVLFLLGFLFPLFVTSVGKR